MKVSNRILFLTILFSMVLFITSCQAIGDIFKAGVWVGVIIVVAVIAVIVYLFSRAGKGK